MLKKTTATLKKAQRSPSWILIDLKEKVLGRAATTISTLLLGKKKATFSPNLPSGDYVIAINASHVGISGKKETDKKYYRYSGYPGGLHVKDLKTLRKEKPQEILRHAVWGMLPKNRLGKELIGRLYIYEGSEHPHNAQQPVEVKI